MLDFIKDIFSAFRQSSIERIKNPFVGAFVFSWLGFNWQVLAIILFSKKDVIERVDYIKAHYDVGHFILAPSLTTIVICIILPWANKIFTKLQSKPIGDTTSILMQAKIDIAEKQLQIAEFEAKKKLAEKREERNIEEDISSTKKQLSDTLEKNAELSEALKELTISLKKEIESRHNKELELNLKSEQLKTSSDAYKKIFEDKSSRDKYIIELEETNRNNQNALVKLKAANTDLHLKYPNIFGLTPSEMLRVKGHAQDDLELLDKNNIPF